MEGFGCSTNAYVKIYNLSVLPYKLGMTDLSAEGHKLNITTPNWLCSVDIDPNQAVAEDNQLQL